MQTGANGCSQVAPEITRFRAFRDQFGISPMKPTPPPSWRVEIAEHQLAGGRWTFPATTVTVPALDADGARREALRMLFAAGDLPPWRPLIRESWPHSTAEPFEYSVETIEAFRLPVGGPVDVELERAA